MSAMVKDFLWRKGRKGDVGLELEVEGKDTLPIMDNDTWTTVHEGSLRDYGAEYITKGPLEIQKVPDALRLLTRELHKEQYRVVKDSPRTSFHVHINQLYTTPTIFWTQATCYWLLENLLFESLDKRRKGNHFCLRLRDSEGLIGSCLTDLRAVIPFTTLDGNSIRYAGQNLAAVSKYGSLEYRGMEGTIEADKLVTWTTALHSMCTKAKEFDSPAALMDWYFLVPHEDFVKRFFPESFANTLLRSRDAKELLFENAGILCELAYYHDWKEWSKKINESLKTASKEDYIRLNTGDDFDDTDVPVQSPVRRRFGLEGLVRAATGATNRAPTPPRNSSDQLGVRNTSGSGTWTVPSGQSGDSS